MPTFTHDPPFAFKVLVHLDNSRQDQIDRSREWRVWLTSYSVEGRTSLMAISTSRYVPSPESSVTDRRMRSLPEVK